MLIKKLGRRDYADVWQEMKSFTEHRDEKTPDEIWVVEHSPVFTQGQVGKPEHIINPGDIPIVQTDRGGQVTYHAPGQLVVYPLIDLKRLNLSVREYVFILEQTVIRLLADYNVIAATRENAPGVYVEDAKICSIGLKVRKGCTYHGLALNVDMDLEPFSRINPCGFERLEMTQLSELSSDSFADIEDKICFYLAEFLNKA